VPIETYLINAKIPVDFCGESIKLLEILSEYENDEVLNLVVIV
jgi:hypothetical protein